MGLFYLTGGYAFGAGCSARCCDVVEPAECDDPPYALSFQARLDELDEAGVSQGRLASSESNQFSLVRLFASAGR